jgi:hypothetical protein
MMTARPPEKNFDERRARGMAREIVAHHFGGIRPKRVIALGGGLTNMVFEVNHAEGDFIVRLGTEPGKVKEYFKEQWAVAKAVEAGVPVAEILEVGADLGPLPYMVARKASGTEATHHPARFAILRGGGRQGRARTVPDPLVRRPRSVFPVRRDPTLHRTGAFVPRPKHDTIRPRRDV